MQLGVAGSLLHNGGLGQLSGHLGVQIETDFLNLCMRILGARDQACHCADQPVKVGGSGIGTLHLFNEAARVSFLRFEMQGDAHAHSCQDD